MRSLFLHITTQNSQYNLICYTVLTFLNIELQTRAKLSVFAAYVVMCLCETEKLVVRPHILHSELLSVQRN
jgi:hypothetical protein